jgi:antitoxin (DNA-binding transcriptional repressor) of toxin-antitoxin stability system
LTYPGGCLVAPFSAASFEADGGAVVCVVVGLWFWIFRFSRVLRIRDGDLWIFYRVEDDQVLVDAIGRKRGSQLFIGGRSGSVVITKNGRPCAALVPVTEDTDLEALALAQNKRFWKLIDDAIERGKKEGFLCGDHRHRFNVSSTDAACREGLSRWIELNERVRDAGMVCRRCGVSRPTLRKRWRRYQAQGTAGLITQSHRPARVCATQGLRAGGAADPRRCT